METVRIFSFLGALFFALNFVGTTFAFNLNREERQWGMYKAFHDMLPTGKHTINLFGLGQVTLGVNEDGSTSFGGHLEPIQGMSIGGQMEVGGSEEAGLAVQAHGAGSFKNEALGIDTGASGEYEGQLKGLSGHQRAHGEGGVMIGGVGIHGGLKGASGLSLSTSGISAELSAGGNAGADVKGLASLHGGAEAGVGGSVGAGGVGLNASGGVEGGASLQAAV